jgi:hypothetical protein
VACRVPEEGLAAGVAEYGDPCRMPEPPGGEPLPANRIGRLFGEWSGRLSGRPDSDTMEKWLRDATGWSTDGSMGGVRDSFKIISR